MARTIVMMATLVMVLLVNTGCFDITEYIKLNEDLSGTTTIEVAIDMEAMLGPLAAMAGEDFDFEAEMQDVMAKQEAELDPKIRELESNLPAGMRLISNEQRVEGTRIIVSLAVAFDDLDTFAAFRRQGSMNQLGDDAGAQSPIGGVMVNREQGRLTLQFDALSTDDDETDAAAADEEDAAMQAMVQQMLGGNMTISLVVETPFQVEDHNATSVEGAVARWTYDMADLTRLSAEGAAPAPRLVVRTNKKAPQAVVTDLDATPAEGSQLTALSGKTQITLVPVDGATIRIEGHSHKVAPFYMATTEVTHRQWKKVMRRKAACTEGCSKQHPVKNVSWNDAIAFANALSQLEGLRPCYIIDGDRVQAPDGQSCPGYRIPIEAEWEVAARAGSTDRYPWGNSANGASAFAWHAGNSEGASQPVGGKEPNRSGVQDLSGNVAEWVFDLYSRNGSDRVARGGSFADAPETLESSARRGYPPSVGQTHVGVRVVRTAP